MTFSILPEARWIWPKNTLYLNNSYAGFRYDFTQTELPSEAPFVITADQSYKLHVNGKYVCRGPMRGMQENWHFDTVDLLPWLKKGHNWISIEAHNPGISTFYYHHRDAAGMLCSAFWDNGVKIFSNANEWIAFRNTAYQHNTAHLSSQMGKMEELDLRFDDRSWITEESGFSLPPPMPGMLCIEKSQGALPWSSLVPRKIPMLREEFLPPGTITDSGEGISAEIPPQAPGIVRNTVDEFLKYESGTIRHDNTAVPVEKTEHSLSFTIPAPGKGKFRFVTIDLGANDWLPGVPLFKFGECKPGTVIDIFYHQYLKDGKIAFEQTPDQGSLISLASRLHLNGKSQKVELFQIMGARNVSLVIRDTEDPLPVEFSWRSAVYPLEISGNFSCSDELLNRIYECSVHTQKVCSMDAFVDTPWREQSQWWGDARVQAENTFFLTGDTKLFSAGIRSITEQTNPYGLTFANAPTKSSGPVLPDFCLTWIITLRDLWFKTGSAKHFHEYKNHAEKIFAYFENIRTRDGLIPWDPKFWLFEDWSSLPKRNTPAFINLWYIYAEEKYLEILCAADYQDDAKALRKKIENEKTIIREMFFDAGQQLFLPERNHEKELTGQPSVHDQVLALLIDLAPDAKDSMISRIVLPCLQGTLENGAQPSSFWATYLLDCAFKYGLRKEAVEYIRRMWKTMLPAGTVWENFQQYTNSELSYSHAWSAHPIHHLPKLIFGLEQLNAGWNSIRIKPEYFPGNAQFSLPIQQGDLKGKIYGKEDDFSVEFEIPDGVNAEIILPGEIIHSTGGIFRENGLCAGNGTDPAGI